MDWPTELGTVCFIRKDNQTLFFYRNRGEVVDMHHGFHVPPGGHFNRGEMGIDCARREVKEETGLEIISEPRLLAAQDIMTSDKEHVVRLTYVADTVGEPILDTAENVDYRWLTKDEIRVKPDLDIYAKEVLKSGLI